ncbi:THH1/TOM1/TOM3 domain - like 5 [Theobroma cacao]|nr:THH1/TOM1/TOM3 domain - like 5 [Theobroma cacao]
MFEEKEKSCTFPRELVGVNVGLAFFDGIIAVIAFSQLVQLHPFACSPICLPKRNGGLSCSSTDSLQEFTTRMDSPERRILVTLLTPLEFGETGRLYHSGISRMEERGSILSMVQWRQKIDLGLKSMFSKVFHLLIGSTNAGYFVYFVLTLVAACRGWLCWSYSCGFIAMAFPRILFFATFLLLLSFWVDLCHQADDEEEEDDEQGFLEALLQNSLNRPRSSTTDSRRICYPFRLIHVGSRQKIVILVTVLVFLFMLTFAVLIWIGMEDNPIDSSTVARVYVDLFAAAILLLGGALACYGLLLCRKMRNVRSERASSEIWKVAGLAIVSVLCFTSSALVALLTDIPVLYHWHELHIDGVYTSLLLILYYFIGSAVPSAFVLWVMRELPPMSANIQEESTTVFITDDPVEIRRPQSWATAASSQNQAWYCLYIRYTPETGSDLVRDWIYGRDPLTCGCYRRDQEVVLYNCSVIRKHVCLSSQASNVSWKLEKSDAIRVDCAMSSDQKVTIADLTGQSEYSRKVAIAHAMFLTFGAWK